MALGDTWPLSADVNECQQVPEPCTYQCHNLQGSYRCLCPAGYTLLHDGKACTVLLEWKGQNVTTVSHRSPVMPWLRPRAPIPGGSHHAWVSLRPGPGALSSVGRAWCPPGFIWQNGACVGKAGPCHSQERTPVILAPAWTWAPPRAHGEAGGGWVKDKADVDLPGTGWW